MFSSVPPPSLPSSSGLLSRSPEPHGWSLLVVYCTVMHGPHCIVCMVSQSDWFCWWLGGGVVEREGGSGRRGWHPHPLPLPLLPSACWEWELEAGAELEGSTEGHNTLFSPLNPSVTCHMFLMNVERKTVERRKGGWGGSGGKRTVRGRFWSPFFSFFSPWLWQTRD